MNAQKKKLIGSDSRDRIVARSTALFLEKGFSGTSMSAIAQANDMTKASLYYHFPSKEALFAACVTEGYGRALSKLTDIVEDTSLGPVQKFEKAMVILYETTVSSAVGQMSPLIAEVSRKFPSVAASFHGNYIQPQQALMRKLVDQGVAEGVFADIDNKLLTHLVFGPMVTLSLSREMFASFEDLDDHFPVTELRDGHTKALLLQLAALT